MKKKQDDKLIIGIAGVVALVLIVLGVLSFTSRDKKFPSDSARSRELAAMEEMVKAQEAEALLTEGPQWQGSKAAGRNLDLMTSVPIFKIPGSPNLVDLHAEGGSKVHDPIPNRWWLTHGIDPSYKNALKRDADKDGFTNLEEFNAKTNPVNAKDHPPLISKLVVKGATSSRYKIVFQTSLGEGKNQFRYFDLKNPRGLRSQYVAAGGDIFAGTPLEGRFTLNAVTETEEDKGGYVRKGLSASILDTQRGKVIEIPKKSKNDIEIKVYTVTFSLKALGKNRESFSLTENSKFDLPDGKVSENGKFHFQEVRNGNEVVISYEQDGEKIEKVIPLN